MPYYAENCASMLAITYSSGQGPLRNIVSFLVHIKKSFKVIFPCELVLRLVLQEQVRTSVGEDVRSYNIVTRLTLILHR